jgi:class 3 adenylate cyclase
VIGNRKFAFDIWGETVNVASRLESQGVPDRVQVSAATWSSVEHLFDAESVGPVEIRGYGPMDTYMIVGPRRKAKMPIVARPRYSIASRLEEGVASAAHG